MGRPSPQYSFLIHSTLPYNTHSTSTPLILTILTLHPLHSSYSPRHPLSLRRLTNPIRLPSTLFYYGYWSPFAGSLGIARTRLLDQTSMDVFLFPRRVQFRYSNDDQFVKESRFCLCCWEFLLFQSLLQDVCLFLTKKMNRIQIIK